MAESYPENSVVLRMEPLSWDNEDYFEMVTQFDTLEEARYNAIHASCMSGTRTIHVYGEGGELAFFYDKATNFFSPVSDTAKEWHERERKSIHDEAMAHNRKKLEQDRQQRSAN